MNSPVRHRFTLLEVLVALLLLTMVILVVVMATSTVMQGWDRLNVNQRRFEEVQQIDRAVESIFPNIVPFTWQDDTGTPYPMFEGTESAVLLTYLHPLNKLEDGALRFCFLQQEDDLLVVYYCERPPFPEELDDDKLRRSVLAVGVEEVLFRYGDIAGEDIVFETDWVDLNYTPLALSMSVRWQDGTVRNWLRRAGGSSYYERWGDWKQEPIR